MQGAGVAAAQYILSRAEGPVPVLSLSKGAGAWEVSPQIPFLQPEREQTARDAQRAPATIIAVMYWQGAEKSGQRDQKCWCDTAG